MHRSIQATLASLPAHTGRAPFLSMPADAEPFETIPGEKVTLRVRGRDVGGRFCVVESVAEPRASPPLHYHREDEIFHILEGTLQFVCDGRSFAVGPGGIVVVPAGVQHSWANLTDKPTRMTVTFVPGGIDELFAEIPGLAPDELPERAARYGTFIVGPHIVP